jgi:hypothetical protein
MVNRMLCRSKVYFELGSVSCSSYTQRVQSKKLLRYMQIVQALVDFVTQEQHEMHGRISY